MAFGDPPERTFVPTVTSIAVVLGLDMVLNAREKTYGPGNSDGPPSVPLDVSID
jgi:hypothetical protein